MTDYERLAVDLGVSDGQRAVASRDSKAEGKLR